MKNLILIIEKNKFIANLFRFIYRKTVLKYKLYNQNKNFLKYSEETLTQVNKVFKELNIEYWLEFGTLLGAVREKNFIQHDLDIDIGLLLDNYSNDIQQTFKKYNFVKTRDILIDNGQYGREESYIYKNIVVDLFYFSVNQNKIYTHVFKNEEGMSWYKTVEKYGGLIAKEISFPYTGFSKIEFLNNMYPVPHDVDLHLKAFYGEKYMIKDKSWNPDTMAKNITILTNRVGVVKHYE